VLGTSITTPVRLGTLVSADFDALGWRWAGLAASTGTRVRLWVPCAPGAVSGGWGSGIPHIPQKRLPAWFSYPQALQITKPPLRIILNDEPPFAYQMKKAGMVLIALPVGEEQFQFLLVVE
jgi:hypothetical protein